MNESLKLHKKANFHLHLTGSLTPRDLRHLSKITGIDLSTYEPLEDHLKFMDPAIWAAAKEVTSDANGLAEAIKLVLKREAQDNVVYVELTINPAGMIRRGMTVQKIVSSINEALCFGITIGITCKIKTGVNRKDGPDSVQTVKNVFFALDPKNRVCIDLNGDEREFPTSTFIEEFSVLASDGIPTSIHAGEHKGFRHSIIDALKMHPARIAHAVAAVEDIAIIQKIIEQGIILEIAPLSNIKTGAVSNLKDHPIKKFLEHDIPIVLGSDDPAFFETTMTSELDALIRTGIDEEKVLEINRRSLEIAGVLTRL